MAKSTGNRSWQKALIVLAGTVLAVVVITCLYWAQAIFIPLALAIFLTFLLSPLVSYLQRKGIRRGVAVTGVMLMTVLLLGSLVWLVSTQFSALLARLPQYSHNIEAKVKVITDRVEHFHSSINRLMTPRSESGEEKGEAAPPQTVVVKPASPPWVSTLPEMVLPAVHAFGGGALAVVLTAFMILKREDLRNRLIRLAGQGNVTVATRAIDEAGQRISRFLIMQAAIGVGVGVAIGLGLLLIGVEYALLWGFLIFTLRYIPYIGIWFAALPPILLSLAMSEGWTQPIEVVVLILVVEMIAANVLEPMLFGHSMGVSEVSLLVSAAFWAFLWGPIGMVLSSPITVCLVVLGKYYPRLKFLDVLLGDEPALEPDVRYYQRLLARDQDEASEIVQNQLEQEETTGEQVLDHLLVKALMFAKRDRDRDDLSEDDEQFILETTLEIGEEVAERLAVPDRIPTGPIAGISDEAVPTRVKVVGCPANDDEDEVALQLLARTLDPNYWEMDVLSAEARATALLGQFAKEEPDVICIASLPPSGLAHTRYLCKRLRLRFPKVKLLVARWGVESLNDQNAEQLRQAGADFVSISLVETRAQFQAWRPELIGGDAKQPTPPRREQTVSV